MYKRQFSLIFYSVLFFVESLLKFNANYLERDIPIIAQETNVSSKSGHVAMDRFKNIKHHDVLGISGMSELFIEKSKESEETWVSCSSLNLKETKTGYTFNNSYIESLK